jgi:hypothetical protein
LPLFGFLTTQKKEPGMDAKKHPAERYENLAAHERHLAQNAEHSVDASESELGVFVR